jgi:ferritin-like metal-binding protein YciE
MNMGMKMNIAKGNTQLEKFFEGLLKDIYWAEKALTKALPKMLHAATTEQLQSAIETHIVQTNDHVSRLEQVFHGEASASEEMRRHGRPVERG